MPRKLAKYTTTAASCAALVLTSIVAVSSAQAAPIRLVDILSTDPLGYDCVQSSYLEETDDGVAAIAFSLSGKTRLPRTCLPEPCARALTPSELSALTGTEIILARFNNEWDDYYARYAEFCRKETVAFTKPPFSRQLALVPPVTATTFWTPVIQRARPPVPSSVVTRRNVPPLGGGFPFDAPRPLPPGDRGDGDENVPKSIFRMTSAGGESGAPYSRPLPSPVPLPTSGSLLAAIMAFAVLRRA